jgi:hypothetical protein
MAFFKSAPGVNRATLRAAILMVAPVCGLRPLRALRDATANVPNPIKATRSPFFNAWVMLSTVVSIAEAACVLVSPHPAAILSTKSPLFISLSPPRSSGAGTVCKRPKARDRSHSRPDLRNVNCENPRQIAPSGHATSQNPIKLRLPCHCPYTTGYATRSCVALRASGAAYLPSMAVGIGAVARPVERSPARPGLSQPFGGARFPQLFPLLHSFCTA